MSPPQLRRVHHQTITLAQELDSRHTEHRAGTTLLVFALRHEVLVGH